MDNKIIIEKLKRIKPELARKYGVTDLALFGSYSRGSKHEKVISISWLILMSLLVWLILMLPMIFKAFFQTKKYKLYQKEA